MAREEEEEALLMERRWRKWKDEQEKRGNYNTAKPVDPQEILGGAAPPASKRQTKKKVKGADPMTKMKTFFSDPIQRHTYCKWERFDDED